MEIILDLFIIGSINCNNLNQIVILEMLDYKDYGWI